jgi:UDPglucose 6-dehydrogenase
MNKWFTEKFFLICLISIPFFAYGTPDRSTRINSPITVIGTGYVGLVLGACLADLGHTVTCCDVDQNKIEMLSKGHIPIYENGLQEIVQKNTQAKRLYFSTNICESILNSPYIFITVGTPEGKNGEANLTYIFNVAETIGKNLNDKKTIFVKSTVPMGTLEWIKGVIEQNNSKKVPFNLGYAPEFLREGSSVEDFMHPDRIVIGADNEETADIFALLMQPLLAQGVPLCRTSIASAEMIKYASNSFLSIKISFINEIADFCEKIGANVEEVALAVGLDKRIGKAFLKPGPGYGGSCFPKDTLAFLKTAETYGIDLKTVDAAVQTNSVRASKIVEKLETRFGTLAGLKIAVLGLAFKEETDDVRESPALKLIESLQKKGAILKCYDPIATNNALRVFPNLTTFSQPLDAIEDSDVLLIATPWKEFLKIDFNEVYNRMGNKFIFDTRNLLDGNYLHSIGFEVESIGKKYL